MKYYSEKTKKLYDDKKSLDAAEIEFDTVAEKERIKKETRAKRAKEVEDAYKKAEELLDKFIKDYGSYHTSMTSTPISLFDIFDRFF